MDTVPRIWTTKGNLPIDSLQYSVLWEETDGYIKFIETYRIDAEIVRQSAHVKIKDTRAAETDAGRLGAGG